MDRFAMSHSHPPPSSPSSEKVEPVKSFPCLERYLEVNLGLTPAAGQTSLVNCSDDSVIDLDVSDDNINLDGIIFGKIKLIKLESLRNQELRMLQTSQNRIMKMTRTK